MNYNEAKIIKQQLEDKNKEDGNKLKKYDEFVNEIGILPDHIRESNEYQNLKRNFDKSFMELREFNGWFVKKFKKEYRAERANRFKKAE